MKDYLIIGHGLAGAVLSHLLIRSGKTLTVVDEPRRNISSTVAAGLFNPITGRRMVRTWLADRLFPELIKTYREMETTLNCSFLHCPGLYRPFTDVSEQNDWHGKSSDELYADYIDHIDNEPLREISLNDHAGGLHVAQAGYLDIPVLLEANKKRLIGIESYREDCFDEQSVERISGFCNYGGENYKAIVFCNGIRAQGSGYFGWLPFRPVKGELLIMNPDKPMPRIYNRGIFIMPRTDGRVKVGSTYQNNFDHHDATEAGRQELLERLSVLSQERFDVLRHLAGVRPATKDRRPMIGNHPKYEDIYLFNGFGSKGVSLVPYFARQFVNHLETGASMDEEVDLKRYLKYYIPVVKS